MNIVNVYVYLHMNYQWPLLMAIPLVASHVLIAWISTVQPMANLTHESADIRVFFDFI